MFPFSLVDKNKKKGTPLKFALDAGGGHSSKDRRNALALQAMQDGYRQEDYMQDTLIPDSILEPPQETIPMHDHMKYTWKRTKQLGMVIGSKVEPRLDKNSLFNGKYNFTLTKLGETQGYEYNK